MKIKAFSPKQRRVMGWWSPRSADRHFDAIICDGAVRSGKTLCMGLSFVCWAMASFQGEQFAFCGKSVVSLRRNLVQELIPTLRELGFQCREKCSENLLMIRRGGRENRFYLMGGKDEGSAAFIQGVTLAGVLLDEVALMPRSFVEQAIARCSVAGSKLWFNCNPEGSQKLYSSALQYRELDMPVGVHAHLAHRSPPERPAPGPVQLRVHRPPADIQRLPYRFEVRGPLLLLRGQDRQLAVELLIIRPVRL